ncbi:hypothetical protein [Pseudomonas phage vB_PsaM_M1]|nr:hypothetical protein [Pseudomonas phage vB_PsaM_M1]
MPELEYEDFNEIMSHQQSHIAMELGEDLAAILAEVGQDD